MGDRRRARLELKDVLKSCVWPALVQGTCGTGYRLIQIELPSQPRPFLAEIRQVDEQVAPDWHIQRSAPVLDVWVRQLFRSRKDAWLHGRRVLVEDIAKIELRQHRPIVPHVEANEWRIQTQQEQAVADSQGIVKNTVSSPGHHISERLPRYSGARRPVVAVRLVKRFG